MLDGEAFFASVPEAALLLDWAGSVLAANARARALIGSADGAPLEGRSIRDLVALRDDATIKAGEIEARIPGPDPRVLTLLVGEVPGSKPRFLAIVRDRTRDERTFQLRLSREKSETVSQLAAGVAHEFNNIMASLYGFAQLARQDPQFHAELIEAVEHSAERSREITRRLRSLSPEQFLPLTPVDVVDLLEDIVARHAPALARSQIRISLKTEAGIPPTIGSRAELEEVFESLIENARLAVVKSGEITVEAAREGAWIAIRVRDTGFGIPRENLTRVFEPFFVVKATEGAVTGDGLGLAVSYSHVRRHGGEIWAESEVGRGTTFHVRLPVRADRRRRQVDVEVDRRRPPGVKARTILAVDDEEGMLKLLESILGRHRVVTARSGREAMAALRHGPFDYVILDLILKGELDGFTVFDEVARRDRDAKIILLTGRGEDEKQRDYAARAYGYLKKPFGIKDVQSLIV